MSNPLVVDLETKKPEGLTGDPDFRVDEITQAGWLGMDEDTAHWSGCTCPLPEFDPIICHNAMYDVGILTRQAVFDKDRQAFIRHVNVHDTMALAYSQGYQDLSLKGLGQSLLGVDTVPYEQRHLIGEEQYLAQDLFLTRDLLKLLLEQKRGTAYDIDRALIPALIDTSYRGYEIDQDRLEQAIRDAERVCCRSEVAFDKIVEGESVLKARRKVTRKKWPEDTTGLYGEDVVTGEGATRYRETWGPPVIGSPTQLQRYFGVDSVDKSFLEAMVQGEGDKAVAALLRQQWVKADKLLDTYFYPLRGKEKLTGLFNITPGESGEGGAGTGRLSSERANMQNQPPAMERCLRAPEGYLLLRADYPQIELRCAGETSNDEIMLDSYKRGLDLHQITMDRLGLTDRREAKRFNFRELYIGGEAVKKAYPGFYAWAQRHWADVQRTGYSVAPEPFLHKRAIPLLAGDHAYKAAINHPIQSLAVYITKAAMVEMFREGYLLVNQIHDAVHCYVPEDSDLELHRRNVSGIMSSVARKYLPRTGADITPADVKISRYWED